MYVIAHLSIARPLPQAAAAASLGPLGLAQRSEFIWVCQDLPDGCQEVALLWCQTIWSRGKCVRACACVCLWTVISWKLKVILPWAQIETMSQRIIICSQIKNTTQWLLYSQELVHDCSFNKLYPKYSVNLLHVCPISTTVTPLYAVFTLTVSYCSVL